MLELWVFISTLLRPMDTDYPTFEKDVRPIIANRCVSCHGVDWLEYGHIFKNRDDITYRVWQIEDMPPTKITNEERNIINDWVTTGAPRK